jgi:hypothetical protein
VTARFGEKQSSTAAGSFGYLSEELRGVRHLVNHCERQNEIDGVTQIGGGQRVWRRDPSVYAIRQSGFGHTSLQPTDHLGLKIHGYDFAVRTDEPRQFQRKEPHARSGLEYFLPFAHKWRENFPRVLPQFSKRRCEEIAQPPRAHAVRFHCLLFGHELAPFNRERYGVAAT